ncbi:MAG: EAL domain-containing protein [Acidobacteria bacterium]|nr:EAL domain-containing protein [Acidobacteriota bacterium]
MLSWLGKQTPVAEEEHGLLATEILEASRLVDYLVGQISTPHVAESVLAGVAQFREASPYEQQRMLPAVYLLLQQYLTEVDPRPKLSKAALDNVVRARYKLLFALPHFRLIFEPLERQELLLCQHLLKDLFRRAFSLLGGTRGNVLGDGLEWVSAVPDLAALPVPFAAAAALPEEDGEWVALLCQISRKLYQHLQEDLGEKARFIFESAYQEFARIYVGLETFAVVLHLLPVDLLDEMRIGLLSRNQVQRILFDKVEHLERTQIELAKARDELEVKVRERTRELVEANSKLQAEIKVREQFEAQLTHLANHDPLTGLFNRRRFEEELGYHLGEARRYGTHGALLWMDLDGFKHVNDSFGHQVGDQLLVSLATILQRQVRETDIVARLGGDEFVILSPKINAEQAEALCQKVVQKLRHHSVVLNDQPVGASVSMGVALYPDHGLASDTLLAHADLALYRAKEEGRNCFVFFTPERDSLESVARQVKQEQQIREALSSRLFLRYLQPIVDLQDNDIFGYEFLLRLKLDDDRVLTPGAFLAVAERYGLIRDLDRWVLRQAVRMIASLEGSLPQVGSRTPCVGINLSAKALADDDLLETIQSELRKAGVDPARLIIEITESAAIANVEQAHAFIESLKNLGCRFALDDFGVGFSSLYHLKNLRVDYLKIDGHFISNLSENPADQELVRAIVHMAHGLGIRVVAEQVEDEGILQHLRALGVDYVQGNFLGRPEPA